MKIVKCDTKERMQLLVIHAVTLIDSIVGLFSFGFVETELRQKALFEWFNND